MYLPTAFFSSDTETFASGGLEYTFSSGSELYRSHYFNMPKDYQGGGTLNTTLTVLQPITASVRLVGGGGVNGGPFSGGGGGGGGGFLQSQSVEFGTGSISIGIGMGGITGSDADERGKSGNDSTLSYGTISMLAFGGGGGGADTSQFSKNPQGKDGGSGGGSGRTFGTTTGPAGGSTLDSAQGKDGHIFVYRAFQPPMGGGGGAGEVRHLGWDSYGLGDGPVTESIFHGLPALYSGGSNGTAVSDIYQLSGGAQQDTNVNSGSYGSCMITYQIGTINLNDTITRRFTKTKGVEFQIYSVEGGTGNLVETIATGSIGTTIDVCMPRQGSWVLAWNGGSNTATDFDGNFFRIPTLNSGLIESSVFGTDEFATITVIGNC